MAEENQNVQFGTQSKLRQETEAFNRTKALLKEKISNDLSLRRAKENEVLYEKSLTSSDSNTCGQYDRACKAGELARGARSYGASKGYDWSNIEDADLLNQYATLFPESSNIMYDYITQPQETDPMPYYIKLGWEQPTEEDEAESYLGKRWDNFKWSFGKAGQSLRTLYNMQKDSEERIKGNGGYKEGALYDYIWDKYGKWSSQLTDDERKEVERDTRLNPDLLKKYMSQSNAVKDAIMGFSVSALNATPGGLLFNLGTTGLAATEPGEEAFGMLGQGAETLGYYANKFPGLKQYRDSLPTEEDKRERDQFVGQEIISLITRGAIKGYKEIKSLANDSGNGGGGGFGGGLWEKFQEDRKLKLVEKEAKIKEKMNEKANESLVDPEIWQSEQAANAYSQLSQEAIKRIKKSKNKSKTVLEELDKISKAYENAENAIVDTIDKMYGTDYSYEDPISIKQGGKEYTSNLPRKYVQEWIDLMKDIAEYQQEQQYIDLAEQIARDGNLTPYNVIEMARALSKQFDLWSVGKEGPELSKIKAKVDSTRQGLKNILKRELDKSPERQETGVNPLEYYDSLWSPVIGTRSNIVKLRSAWNKAKSKMNKTTLNRVLGWIGKIPFTRAKAVKESLNAAKSLGGENILDLVTKEKNLGKIIKEVNELSKKLSGDPTKAYIDDVMANREKEHPGMLDDIGGLLEGEVIEPESKGGWTKGRNRYLEEMFDTVEIETPKGLVENEGVGPDLQVPIVSDENGYVGRRGKTTESYKGKTKGEGWTPADWNKSAENYAAKHGNTLEAWKKQLEAAGISPEAIEILIEKLAKKNFKSSSVQPPLF